jgi:hypothetical protein
MIICETCGAPATNGAQDLIEIEPVKDKYGIPWSQWLGVGVRYGCDMHPETLSHIYRWGDKDYPHELVIEMAGG